MKLRNILLVIGLIGLAIVVILNIKQLNNFFHLLSTLRWYVLVVVVAVQLLSYYLNALYYHSILKIFGDYNVSTRRLFEGAMAANFVNYIIPSAGMVGAGFLSQVLAPEVPRGKGVLVQFMRYGLSALAVLILIPISIGLIVITRHGSPALDKIALSTALAILAFAVVVVFLVNQEKWLRRAVKWLEVRFKRLFKRFAETKIDNFVDEFFIGYKSMVKGKAEMLKPFGWSIIYELEEILTLYLAFLAFGKLVNPGVVIMGYAVANISSALGGAFFSFGVFELGMVGAFVALGEPFVLALSITLVYRITNLIIGLPPGFVFYHKYLPKSKGSS